MSFAPSNSLYAMLMHSCGGEGSVKELVDAINNSGTGTVTTVSIVSASGVSGSVANPTTTPAITISLGAITPTSVVASGAVSGSNLSGTNTGDQTITLTGNVTGSGSGSFAATIAVHAVTYGKMQQAGAATLLGNPTGGSADLSEITLGAGLSFVGSTLTASAGSGTVTTVSVVTANGVSGSVANPTTTPAITLTLGAITPSSVAASGSVSGSNLSGTNTGDQTITLTGNVTGSGSASIATTIADNVVTYAKMQQEAASTLLGNPTNATANVSEITLGAGIGFYGTAGTQVDSNWTTSVVNNIEIPANSTTVIFDDPCVVNSGQVAIIDSGGLLNVTLTDKLEDWVTTVSPNDVEIPPNCTKLVVDDPYVVTPGTVTILDALALLTLTQTQQFSLLKVVFFSNLDSPFVYYPSPQANALLVWCVGGGGGGGGVALAGATGGAGGGGGGGALEILFLSNPSQYQGFYGTVDPGGAGGAAGNNAGTSGGQTTLFTLASTSSGPSSGSVLCRANGGSGGGGSLSGSSVAVDGAGGAGGNTVGTVGTRAFRGGPGGYGLVLSASAALGGHGGISPLFGVGAIATKGANPGAAGASGNGNGEGGGGAAVISSGAAAAGGAGGSGAVVIWEFS